MQTRIDPGQHKHEKRHHQARQDVVCRADPRPIGRVRYRAAQREIRQIDDQQHQNGGLARVPVPRGPPLYSREHHSRRGRERRKRKSEPSRRRRFDIRRPIPARKAHHGVDRGNDVSDHRDHRARHVEHDQPGPFRRREPLGGRHPDERQHRHRRQFQHGKRTQPHREYRLLVHSSHTYLNSISEAMTTTPQ